MVKTTIPLFCSLVLSLSLSCSKKDDKDESEIPVITSNSPYADASRWLCLPGREDVCSTPPAVSEFRSDGSFLALADENPDRDDVDCFYVHPTSDLSVKAGNSENFEFLDPVEQLAKMQAAPFQGSCRIFAPLYQQVTIGTYALPEEEREPYLSVAYSDVRKAFEHYMETQNQGRKIAFIGHSQGSEMITRLLKEKFDTDASMREKLLIAIIPGFAVHVKIGDTKGDTFQNIPACREAGELACVVAYRSYKEGTLYLGDGQISLLDASEELCVNPAALDLTTLSADDKREASVSLKGSLLPPSDWVSDSIRLVGSPSPFLIVKEAYSAACQGGPDPRNRFLSIKEEAGEGDARKGVVQLDSASLTGLTGLHTLDLQFPSTELVNLVRSRR